MTKEITYDEALQKLVKFADALDKDQSELTPEMAEIITALTNVHKDDPVGDSWTDVWAMMEDIREHAKNNGRAIVNADMPMQLRLAWHCTNTNKSWSIRITDFKKSAQTADPVKSEIWQMALIQDPIIAAQIKRISNLKAFW